MSDETNESVLDQINDQQEVASPESTDQQQPDRQEETPQPRKRNDVEHNWAETRRVMKEQERRMQMYEEELQRLRQQAKTPEEDSLEKLADDDLTTVAHAKKIAARVAKEAAEAALRQREAETVDERLQAKYSDFDDVVSQENIEYLKLNEPELAFSLRALANDPYAQGVAAYKLLKKIVPQKQSVPVEKLKAEKNVQKPISVNAAPKASTPLGNAHMFENGLTPELKAQLYKEMQEARKAG